MSESAEPVAAVEPEPTGDDRVDTAVARLADLAELPVAAHPAVYEEVHRTLDDALAHPDEE
ncbi:MAG: hypothetical protein MUC45_06480 [Actinomycetia bacterium]|nr:hypothetical protein [Actinomycetes bacterium]